MQSQWHTNDRLPYSAGEYGGSNCLGLQEPITAKGQILYGIFLGIMTGIFRLFGPSAEGVSYAIIIGNLLVPLIERITMPKPFGKGGERS